MIDSDIPLRYLIVDDEERPRRGAVSIISLSLKPKPLVEVAVDASSALARFRTAPWEIDVILTDNNMPGITGIKSASQYTSIAEQAGIPPRPLFVVSGLPSELDMSAGELVKLGVDAIFSKPMKPNDYQRMDALARRLILERQTSK